MNVLGLLRDGELTLEGRLVVASNVTLLGTVKAGRHQALCVYKPVTGERPLWDFPHGTLAAREVAAYELSDMAGWRVVPPTVLRDDGPLGGGMCQLWIEQEVSSPEWVDVTRPGEVAKGWLPVLNAVDDAGAPVVLAHADDPALRRLALFDAVINNADRKGGHILSGTADTNVSARTTDTTGTTGTTGVGGIAAIIGVDHGVCFNVDPKLRTVLWGWAGARLTEVERSELIAVRQGLNGELGRRLGALLAPEEVAATSTRVEELLRDGEMPHPTVRMPVPWPVF